MLVRRNLGNISNNEECINKLLFHFNNALNNSGTLGGECTLYSLFSSPVYEKVPDVNFGYAVKLPTPFFNFYPYYVITGINESFNYNSFTLDFKVRFLPQNNDTKIYSIVSYNNGNNYNFNIIRNNSHKDGNHIEIVTSDNETFTHIIPNINQWFHFAIIKRLNGKSDIYINGGKKGEMTTIKMDSANFSGDDIRIGKGHLSQYEKGLQGYVDEFRLANGEVWKNDFNIPTTEYK